MVCLLSNGRMDLKSASKGLDDTDSLNADYAPYSVLSQSLGAVAQTFPLLNLATIMERESD